MSAARSLLRAACAPLALAQTIAETEPGRVVLETCALAVGGVALAVWALPVGLLVAGGVAVAAVLERRAEGA